MDHRVSDIFELEKKLHDMPNSTLSDAKLIKMGIRRGPLLDVDISATAGSPPVVFHPLADSEQLRSAINAHEKEATGWGICHRDHPELHHG
jgi:hypothetical protein